MKKLSRLLDWEEWIYYIDSVKNNFVSKSCQIQRPETVMVGDQQKDATEQIVEAFDRLVRLGRDGVAQCPESERIVYYVVATRCEKDINGFSSVYEQALDPVEIAVLVEGLNKIGEKELAGEFFHGFELLKHDGFYEHMNWNKVSDFVKSEIERIGARVGDRLWSLDDKLATLCD